MKQSIYNKLLTVYGATPKNEEVDLMVRAAVSHSLGCTLSEAQIKRLDELYEDEAA